MSRTRIRNKFIREAIQDKEQRNIHRKDGMPKNYPSRFITTHCSAFIEWLQEPTYCRGHKIQKNGHRIVSGLVRAKVKKETQAIINQEQED